jgi:hypothetical protein
MIQTGEIVDSSNDFAGLYRARAGLPAGTRRRRRAKQSLMPTVTLYDDRYDAVIEDGAASLAEETQ